jgi:hypothetical protein
VASPAATSSGTQPLLGVGLGLLLGLALSTLLLRTRFLDGLRARLSRGGSKRSPLAGAVADDTFEGTDEWREAGRSSTRLAVGKPAEENYVVEVSDIEPDEATGQPADDTREAATAQASPEDRMLDEIFDENFGDVAGNLDLPEDAFTDVDTVTATDELAPTAAVPAMASAAGAAAPATGSIDAEPTSKLDIDFEVPDFELPDFDAEPATADLPGLPNDATGSLGLDFDLSGLDADAADPEPTTEASTEPTGSLDLQSMVAGSTGNAKLSRTLEEALSLLERDYEDELTASQIIDRESLDAALKDSDATSDDDTRKRRKLTG